MKRIIVLIAIAPKFKALALPMLKWQPRLPLK